MLLTHQRPKGTWIPLWCVLVLCLLAIGCSRDGLLKLFGYDRAALLKMNVGEEDEALARDCVNLLLQNRFAEIEARLDPRIRNAVMREKLAEMSSFFPSKPISVKTVDAGLVRGRGSSTVSITLEYQFPRSWLLAHVVIRTEADVKTITTFAITPTAEPFEVMNEFTFANKGFSQYASFLLALAVAAVTLYAFVLCIRMKIGRKRWVWLVAILAGVCRITVNWTTGEWSFTPLAFQVPPVTVSFTTYGPLMLLICSPVGAIVFLRLRKRLEFEVLPLPTVPGASPAK